VNNALSASRAAAFNSAPGRLHRLVEYAREMGASAVATCDALEQIEDALYGDGLLPIDRASQRRAWAVASGRADREFREGVKLAAARVARDAVSATNGSPYACLYITAWHVGPAAFSDDVIVEAVAAALSEAGLPELPEASLLYPILRAKAARENGNDDELKSLRAPPQASSLVAFVDFDGELLCASVLSAEEAETQDERPSAPRPAFDLDNEPGLLGDIARWSQVFAFRPVREFAQPAALATLSALFGRRWATPTGLGLNLYQVAIAETGGGKDALLGAPRALLSAAGFRHLLGPGDFSSDAAIEKSLRVRPAQLMPLDEFGKLAQAMQGRNAPAFAKLAAKALLEIYPRSAPNSEWTGKARASDEHDCAADPIHSPTLSLLGVSTPEGFFEGMTQENLNDGFLNRLTVIRAGRAGERQRDPSRLTPPPALLDALRAAFEASQPEGNLAGAAARDASMIPHVQFARWADDDALRAIEAVEAWEDDASDAGRRGVAGRAAEQVQKIATLRALSRRPADPAIGADDIRWAFAMVEASIAEIERGARENMAGSDFEALVNAVERAVITAGDEGIAWSHLVQRKGVSKADDRLLEAAVKRLEVSERIWRIGAGGKRLKVRRPDERRDD